MEVIERIEMTYSSLYEEVDLKLLKMIEKYPAMSEDLLDLESKFHEINVQSQKDTYIAGYNMGVVESMGLYEGGKQKPFSLFRRKKQLMQVR
ncbi:hypothetical protein [Mycobacterium tuberculosis]|uniref:hypothetical protein n=1 Tax=Mycobacterium tuberculosis TaxID=1773 RepID=UPI00111546B5|nr:hypothetical protein [Mycobacterium tuberculosis]